MTAMTLHSPILPDETPLRETDFCAWAAQAEPGDALEYHQGFLVVDRSPLTETMDREARLTMVATCDRALCLAEQGLLHLVQRRLGPDRFSYLAVARRRTAHAPVTFATLFA
jgi:hypothetical protein